MPRPGADRSSRRPIQTYNNLIGRIERKARFGAFFTNFSMIRSGSLLQANGGYLLLNALDVLRNPFSWDALKRVIKKNEVKVEDPGGALRRYHGRPQARAHPGLPEGHHARKPLALLPSLLL